MFTEIFRESDRFHAFPEVATPQQREEWTHQPHGSVVTETEGRDSDNKDRVKHLLIYPEDPDDKDDNPQESLRNSPSMEPTTEPGPPSENLPRN